MSKYLEFNTPATKQAMEIASDFRLKNQGLTGLDSVFWNLPEEALYEEVIFRNEGRITEAWCPRSKYRKTYCQRCSRQICSSGTID